MKIIIDAKDTSLSEDKLWQLAGLIDTVLGFSGISSKEECSFKFVNVAQQQDNKDQAENVSQQTIPGSEASTQILRYIKMAQGAIDGKGYITAKGYLTAAAKLLVS